MAVASPSELFVSDENSALAGDVLTKIMPVSNVANVTANRILCIVLLLSSFRESLVSVGPANEVPPAKPACSRKPRLVSGKPPEKHCAIECPPGSPHVLACLSLAAVERAPSSSGWCLLVGGTAVAACAKQTVYSPPSSHATKKHSSHRLASL